MRVIQFDEAMLSRLLEIQHNLYEEKRRWSMEELRGDLLDGGRKHGKNVWVLLEKEEIKGFGGYVDTPAEVGEFYIAPLVAENKIHSSLLISKILEKAREAHARMIRASAFPGEAKIEALEDGGFSRIFDFIILEISLEKRIKDQSLSPLSSLVRQSKRDFVPEKFQELNNASFGEVDNAPPMTLEDARDIWRTPNIRPESLQIWATPGGDYAGYLMLSNSGNIESVAVSPHHRRKGLAKAMVSLALQEAFEAGFATSKAVISSKNIASLQLHQSLGFEERDRRWVFEKRKEK